MAKADGGSLAKTPFLTGVFLISFAMLVFQIVQTRILSVIAWYYLAFFAISVAMLGMTVGAVRVYLRGEELRGGALAATLSNAALACALSMPASLLVQLSLVTTLGWSVVTLVSWSLLLAAMAVPYVFAGIVVSVALTRSPFPIHQVYAVDLLGSALGCVGVVVLLNFTSAPSVILWAGAIAGLSALCFSPRAGRALPRPAWVAAGLALAALLNAVSPIGIRPLLVKDKLEDPARATFERWNSYSRVIAEPEKAGKPQLWGASPNTPDDLVASGIWLNIDGEAGTEMFHFDGTPQSIDFLRYDLVNLAYNLPGIRKSAVIGVGGGRDVMSAHLYGVQDITGVELNPIFVNLHTRDPQYARFSNLGAIPNLHLYVDDARSWFASTPERFDLIQMSMIDTWAATGAGAFSLSENGLYTLEGWRAFLHTLSDGGIFTVSRWYNPGDVNEAGRMVALATAALLDLGVSDARPHLFVAHAQNIATLVLSKSPFTPEQLATLHREVDRLGFGIVVAPDRPPESPLLGRIVAATDLPSLNRAAGSEYLDLTVPTDERPFFFNQLRFSHIFDLLGHSGRGGVISGNIRATAALLVILFASIVAVVTTILVPLRAAARNRDGRLVAAGSAYFALIGLGFMLGEISLLQYFSVYLGHPIYSLAVCLFSLILATGLGSLASERLPIASRRGMLVWGLVVGSLLLALPLGLAHVFQATTGRELAVRIAVSLAVVLPLGFLLGFAFPTGMKLVEAIDADPTPWFWGINGATGVLASVLAVIVSLSFGIRVTLSLAGLCYLGLIPAALWLVAQAQEKAAAAAAAPSSNVTRARPLSARRSGR